MNPTDPKYLSVSDVARRWAVSERTVRRLIQAGTIRAAQFGVSQYSVLMTSVIEHERRSEVRA